MASFISFGVGTSIKENIVEAAEEAAQLARSKIEKDPQLLIVFCTFNYDSKQYSEALKKIRSFFPAGTPLVGGTALSFFGDGKVFDAFSTGGKERGVGVFAVASDYLKIGVGLGDGVDKDPEAAGRIAITSALENLDYNPSVAYMAMVQRGAKDMINFRPMNGLIITPGGTPKHLFIGNSILRGITSVTKKAVRLTGGGTGCLITQDGQFTPTYQFFGDEVYNEAVITVVFGSDLEIGYGTASGFQPLGPGVFVNKAEGWTIKEIEGKPAVEAMAVMFEKEIGIKKEDFVKGPLYAIGAKGYGFGISEVASKSYWPIVPLAVTKEGYVVVTTEVKNGMGIALVENKKENCKNAAVEAAQIMADDVKTADFGLVIMFSCAMRGFILREEYAQEMDMIKQVTGKETAVFGLGSAEEIGFYRTGDMMGSNYIITMMGVSNKLISEV
ncbi:MAG: FIST C-terminal domain-containing protein [Candidatus Wildermuthbacteria bacterium]|nr:FIST C-terminal domain-containing protein [Candidatus Wildermuthbacteria bacterium]